MQYTDIEEIAEWLENKLIIEVQTVRGEDTMVFYFEDGSSMELIVDSIYVDKDTYDG